MGFVHMEWALPFFLRLHGERSKHSAFGEEKWGANSDPGKSAGTGERFSI